MRQIRLSIIAVATFLFFTGAALAQDCETVAMNPFENCGFETGDFTGWVTQDLTNPFFALQVGGAGEGPGFGFFQSDPTQGVWAALTGFDGNGPGTIKVAQDIFILPGSTTLSFDYQCAWDLLNEAEANLDRTFTVNIEESGGGALLQSDLILTAVAKTTAIPDSGSNLTGIVDVSALAGQAVRVSFDWFVPENFSGPAFCQLDNVSISVSNIVRPIPTLSEWGLITTAGILGIIGLIAVRRRKAAA